MIVKIPYSSDIIDLRLETNNVGEIILSSPYPRQSNKSLETFFDESFFQLLNEFLNGDEPTLIIINDHTRPTPSGLILNQIKNIIPIERTSILIASGMHRPTTTSEQQFILGELYKSLRERIYHNNAKNGSFVNLGWTSYGTEVLINNLLEKFKRIITIGSVEPHYFAGLTGGRKSFLPGIASSIPIINNHKFALSDRANVFELANNPVHEDMMEFASFITDKWKVFSIQIVLDRDASIHSIHYGDLTDSFIKACDDAKLIFKREIEKKYKVAIAIARPPLDIDLYQSLKAVENIHSAVEDGGIIILVSPCREGVGEKNFYNLLTSKKSRPEILKEIEENYTFGAHKTYRLLKKMEKYRIWLYSDLDPDIVKEGNLTYIPDLNKGIKKALSAIGENSEVLIVNDATVMVPQVKL
ncbi:MAG: nickel-dependent lactate racemase [bacterium]